METQLDSEDGPSFDADALRHRESVWRAAIGHAAGCPACRAGECETGQRLLDAYETAFRTGR